MGLVLDASAAVALLLDEEGAAAVEALLGSGDARMSIVNVAEVVDVLVRKHLGDADVVEALVDQLLSSVVEPVAPSLGHATAAGELRARLYDRPTSRLSLADCFVLATAKPGDRIATTDAKLAAVARNEGYELVSLA